MEPNNTRKEKNGAAAGPSQSPQGTETTKPEATPALSSAPSASSLSIPPILLEGDEPSAQAVTGPGQKFELGPAPSPEPLEAEEGELPETYGTGRLLLAARDPHCLYAHWDPTTEEQHCYRDQPGHAQLVIRIYLDSPTGRPVTELPVHSESRHWFIPVERGGANYVAELGCYGPKQDWRSLATSETTTTPRGQVAEEKTVEFARVPFEPPAPAAPAPTTVALPVAAPAPVPSEKPSTPAPAPSKPSLPPYSFLPILPPGPALPPQMEQRLTIPSEAPVLPTTAEATTAGAEALPKAPELPPIAAPEFVRAHPARNGHAPTPAPVPAWTPSQQAALVELFGQTFVAAHPQLSSAELVGLLQPLLEKEILSSQAPFVSSPAGGQVPEQKGFWFNVNAELVIYGATEPDAQVTISGQPIQLRPDGTFSLRFALPDGQFELAAAATSIHGDTRSAELKFQRSTQYQGDVSVQPQDPALKPPGTREQ